jgi:hypothetical protein
MNTDKKKAHQNRVPYYGEIIDFRRDWDGDREPSGSGA